MRKFVIGLLLLVVLAFAIAPAAAQDSTIADIVAASASGRNAEFTTLLAALQAADLVGALDGAGPFTVFAPTDAAFATLDPAVLAGLIADPAALSQVLLYHVAPGTYTAADVVARNNTTIPTLQGDGVLVQVRDGSVYLDVSSLVVTTDIEASNGIIHVIDVPLLPPVTDAYDLFVVLGENVAVTEPGGSTVVGPIDRCQTFFMSEYRNGYLFAEGIGGWIDERVVQNVPEDYGQPGGGALLAGCP